MNSNNEAPVQCEQFFLADCLPEMGNINMNLSLRQKKLRRLLIPVAAFVGYYFGILPSFLTVLIWPWLAFLPLCGNFFYQTGNLDWFRPVATTSCQVVFAMLFGCSIAMREKRIASITSGITSLILVWEHLRNSFANGFTQKIATYEFAAAVIVTFMFIGIVCQQTNPTRRT